jgi:hypothetical protein
MSVEPKRGRGYKAPYRTVMVRTPEGIKPVVEKIIDDYKRKALGLSELEEDQKPDELAENSLVTVTKEEAIAKAKELAKVSKKGTKDLLALIDFVYGDTKTE